MTLLQSPAPHSLCNSSNRSTIYKRTHPNRKTHILICALHFTLDVTDAIQNAGRQHR